MELAVGPKMPNWRWWLLVPAFILAAIIGGWIRGPDGGWGLFFILIFGHASWLTALSILAARAESRQQWLHDQDEKDSEWPEYVRLYEKFNHDRRRRV